MRTAARRILSIAPWLLVAAGLFLAWPVQFGGRVNYTIVAGHSMEPTYRLGDLLVGRARSQYKVGDSIVYEVPADQPGAGHRVVHRIVGGDGVNGWVTRGDNNDTADFWRPRNRDVVSATMWRIPKFGYAVLYASSPLTYALIGSVVIGWILWPRDDEDETGSDSPSGVTVPAGTRLPAA